MKNMKTLLFILALLLVASVNAQENIQASEIITKINNGENVTIKDATISGVLDLTKLNNMKQLSHIGNSTKEYLSIVTSELSFFNCVFTNDVLAHVWEEKPNTSYRTNFAEKVTFENCTFKSQSSFKHSEFKRGGHFEGTTFSQEANFKHAAFSENAQFNNGTFLALADFKHTSFAGSANFSKGQFNSYADFKHTSFSGSADFQDALFKKEGDFKHTSFSSGVNFTHARFTGIADFKHASCSGKAQLDETVFEKGVDAQHSNFIKNGITINSR